MGAGVVRLEGADGGALAAAIRALQDESGVAAEIPEEVAGAARRNVADAAVPDLDRTDVPLLTLGPAEPGDRDRAVHVARDAEGYVVHLAVSDVAARVEPGGPVDVEAHRRGQAVRSPVAPAPLYPHEVTESAALVTGEDRAALLWTVRLDSAGEGVDVDVRRALVRVRAHHGFDDAQRAADHNDDEVLSLLREVGELRAKREQVRGGVIVPVPEQLLRVDGEPWTLTDVVPHPVQRWVDQIGVLVGMAAAQLMLYAEVGIVRTLPEADHHVVQRLHRTAHALGLSWPAEQLYHDFVRGLDPSSPAEAVMLRACTDLLSGAGYVGFEDAVPEHPEHAALASEFAHVTAPLSRLVDRYAGEVCVALCADRPVPAWVRAELPGLPAVMAEAGERNARYQRGVLDLALAGVLAPLRGQAFTGVVTDVRPDDPAAGVVVLRDPAVQADVQAAGPLPLGGEIEVRLAEADVAARALRFEQVDR